ncbi:hypothetical protein PPUN109347_27690 [Pseudomonas putida]|nr:hypothetical protein PPUN109347_27690 [Pseudomonas putida]
MLRAGAERSPASAPGAVIALNNRSKADRTGVLGIGGRLGRAWASPWLEGEGMLSTEVER